MDVSKVNIGFSEGRHQRIVYNYQIIVVLMLFTNTELVGLVENSY